MVVDGWLGWFVGVYTPWYACVECLPPYPSAFWIELRVEYIDI